jgi:hypothetical protein
VRRAQLSALQPLSYTGEMNSKVKIFRGKFNFSAADLHIQAICGLSPPPPLATRHAAPTRPSRPSSPPVDHSPSSYSLLYATQSSPLPCRAPPAFIRSDTARSDSSPDIPGQLPAPRYAQRHTLTHITCVTSSPHQRPSPLAPPCLTPIRTTSKNFSYGRDPT